MRIAALGWDRAFGSFARTLAFLAAPSLAGCAVDVPLTHPVAVDEQARRSATIVARVSTRGEVRAALGEPWLASRAWGFEAFRAIGEQRELTIVSALTPPFPIGVFRQRVGGYVIVSYDGAGVVADVAAGSAPEDDSRGLWLHVGRVALGFPASAESRGPQLLADGDALAAHLDARRLTAGCTLVLACAASPLDRWLDESCPDRVSLDGGEIFDLRGFFTSCGDGKCPEGARQHGGFARLPVAVPLPLAAGEHSLAFESGTFKGRSAQRFACAAGEVRYGLVRGEVKRHWWGPKQSTLAARAEITASAPAELGARRLLLYRGGRWLADPGPDH